LEKARGGIRSGYPPAKKTCFLLFIHGVQKSPHQNPSDLRGGRGRGVEKAIAFSGGRHGCDRVEQGQTGRLKNFCGRLRDKRKGTRGYGVSANGRSSGLRPTNRHTGERLISLPNLRGWESATCDFLAPDFARPPMGRTHTFVVPLESERAAVARTADDPGDHGLVGRTGAPRGRGSADSGGTGPREIGRGSRGSGQPRDGAVDSRRGRALETNNTGARALGGNTDPGDARGPGAQIRGRMGGRKKRKTGSKNRDGGGATHPGARVPFGRRGGGTPAGLGGDGGWHGG